LKRTIGIPGRKISTGSLDCKLVVTILDSGDFFWAVYNYEGIKLFDGFTSVGVYYAVMRAYQVTPEKYNIKEIEIVRETDN
jgi:hypothetical protein